MALGRANNVSRGLLKSSVRREINDGGRLAT